MLEKENLDGVTISTPDHTHANISKAAMEKEFMFMFKNL
ncbi:MAG: hypothetical protein CM15mP102_17530 [Flavobacteriales bacterium]|nr:MAG: hypothetical protein CM15mP102_17530 [Flavobacteriales bacterium]